MTLKHKREFIQRFMNGENSLNLVRFYMPQGGMVDWGSDNIFRDYLLGKFKLPAKGKK